MNCATIHKKFFQQVTRPNCQTPVLIPFFYGVVVLHEKNIKTKLVDLGILLVSLVLLVIGSEV